MLGINGTIPDGGRGTTCYVINPGIRHSIKPKSGVSALVYVTWGFRGRTAESTRLCGLQADFYSLQLFTSKHEVYKGINALGNLAYSNPETFIS